MVKVISIFMSALVLSSCGGNSHIIDSNEETNMCEIDLRPEGNFIVCGSKEFQVEDGLDGVDGSNGTSPDLEYVEICPNVSGSYIETLLKLNGKFMAFLSNSNYRRQRLVVLDENVLFSTSDGRNVSFTIISGELIYITTSCI